MIKLIHGDCLQELKKLPDCSVDAVVSDPPAGIAFMNKEWDEDKGSRDAWTAWLTAVMRQVRRVLKPGAHGLIWALPRTSHWTATALENAGFEIRDVVTHVFGSGFPKSLNISIALDKEAGVSRKVIGSKGSMPIQTGDRLCAKAAHDDSRHYDKFERTENLITEPTTAAAKQWQGWGTALKPSSEHWILIRKELSRDTVAKNVKRWGTGGINIDGCRVGTELVESGRAGRADYPDGAMLSGLGTEAALPKVGRFPANTVFSHNEDCKVIGTKRVGSGNSKKLNRKRTGWVISGSVDNVQTANAPDSYGEETVEAWECTEDCAVALLDKQSGVSKSVRIDGGSTRKAQGDSVVTNPSGWKETKRIKKTEGFNDAGGASRFFYCAKVSQAERNAGLEDMPLKSSSKMGAGIRSNVGNGDPGQTSSEDRTAQNHHPTVKSVKLMQYLIKLITPPDGVVIDPFMGSGTTGIAAKKNGFQFIGIEKEKEYFEIAQARIEPKPKAGFQRSYRSTRKEAHGARE